MVALGYGGSHADAGKSIGQSGDEGIAGIIKEDRLGLDVIYLQAKGGKVPPPRDSKFVGALHGKDKKASSSQRAGFLRMP
jgi:restriction system protein